MIAQQAFEMVQDTAAVSHAAVSDDNAGIANRIKNLYIKID